MGEKPFEQAVLERLAAIETNQKYYAEGLCLIRQHGERITAVEGSVKSAHHRIDGIFATAGALGAIAGAVAQFFTAIWPKGGGH